MGPNKAQKVMTVDKATIERVRLPLLRTRVQAAQATTYRKAAFFARVTDGCCSHSRKR